MPFNPKNQLPRPVRVSPRKVSTTAFISVRNSKPVVIDMNYNAGILLRKYTLNPSLGDAFVILNFQDEREAQFFLKASNFTNPEAWFEAITPFVEEGHTLTNFQTWQRKFL